MIEEKDPRTILLDINEPQSVACFKEVDWKKVRQIMTGGLPQIKEELKKFLKEHQEIQAKIFRDEDRAFIRIGFWYTYKDKRRKWALHPERYAKLTEEEIRIVTDFALYLAQSLRVKYDIDSGKGFFLYRIGPKVLPLKK